jgi:hypothetical protein
VLEVFLEQKKKIERAREEETFKIRQAYTDPDNIQNAIDNSSYDYENEIEKYEEEKLLNEIISLTNFSKNKITIAKTYINHYIRDERYKELSTGVSSKQN